MFKKFTKEENVTGHSQIKSSVVRGIRNTIIEQYPMITEVIDQILPKKQPITVTKCQNHVNLITVNNEVVFFNEREGPYYPSLKLLHKYPHILRRVQVDRGAIKFVMQGANIMCPGLTSPGGQLEEKLPAETIVAIFAEGKKQVLAVGITKLSAEDIRDKNKGIAMDNIHYLNDGLWKLT